MQVLQPFFKTLHNFNTLPGWSKGYDVFRAKLADFGKHQQPTSFCTVLLDFESSSIETSFSLLLVVETGKTYPGVDASFHFSNCDRRSMQRKRKFVNKQPHKEKQQRQQRCFIRHFLRFITSILKSLVVLVIWLALIGAIYSQIAPFFALNRIFFPANEEVTLKTKQPIRFQGLFKVTNQIAGKWKTKSIISQILQLLFAYLLFLPPKNGWI